MSRVTAGRRIVRADDAARLHRVGDDAVIVERQAHDMRRLGEGGIGRGNVAVTPVQAEIARRLVGDERRVDGKRRCGRRHRRKRRVIDRDQLGGILCLLSILGDDKRHRLADMAHLVAGQQRLRLEQEWLAGNRVGLGAGAQRRQTVVGGLRGGQCRQHAWRGAGCGSVDARDPRVRVWRAQHHRMREAVERDVVEVAAAPGDEAQILAPLGRVADL